MIPTLIRPEAPADIPAIEAVTSAAFQKEDYSPTEHFIVTALRKSGQLTLSLVAEVEGVVIGHVAVSPVMISSGAVRWYGLGPISVVPARQGQGVGIQLMERALTELRRLGAAGCVVLGNPAYYSRFGFKAESALVLPACRRNIFKPFLLAGQCQRARWLIMHHSAHRVSPHSVWACHFS